MAPLLLAVLMALALGLVLWIDYIIYNWLKRRWPTLAKLLLLFWVLSAVATAYSWVKKQRQDSV